jgi:hypothetical protein
MKCSIKKHLISALCLLLSALPLNACPLCSEAIAGFHGLARGIFWSTLLMLAVPFFVIVVISSLIVKAHRNPPKQP